MFDQIHYYPVVINSNSKLKIFNNLTVPIKFINRKFKAHLFLELFDK